jgi:GT2 family glycosyltransferase
VEISVVIVNYNVRDLLLNAIESVRRSLTGIDAEIIVVDNGSTDGAVAAIQTTYPDVICLPQDRNLGFGRANNIGISVAQGEFTLILNPDTLLQEDTAHEMLTFMRAHPRAGAVGCKIVLPDGTADPAAKRGFPSPWSSFSRVFGLARLFPKSKLFGGYNLTWIDDDETSQVESLAGSFMFFRTSVLKELNGFDEDYFMFGEDIDLCWRTKQAGWEIWYDPATSIMHVKGVSTSRSSLDAIAMFYDAMEVFARKHFRNPLVLWLVRAGIGLRRGLARISRTLPKMKLALLDLVAVLLGLLAGSLIKTGGISFPDYAFPWVFIAPPLPFIIAIAVAGGYGRDYRRLSRTVLGYLGGFFILSTLPYFFESYRFSRGIVLATTGIGAFLGVSVRFFMLLYERTFGSESAHRVAVISSDEMKPSLAVHISRLFLGRPTKIVGVVAPTFSALDSIGEQGLGTIENVGQVVRDEAVSDVVILDEDLSYSDVVRAVQNCSGSAVRFHLLRGEGNIEAGELVETRRISRHPEPYAMHAPLSKRLLDRLLAAVMLLFVPLLYLVGRGRAVSIRALFDALIGRRPFVRGAHVSETEPKPVFTAMTLFTDDNLDMASLGEVERYYDTNRSLLLDCEIVITALRFAKRRRTTEDALARERA